MKNLPTPYQDFIHKSRYARWNETDKRREDWDETVDRYLDYVTEHVKKEHDFDIEGHIYTLEETGQIVRLFICINITYIHSPLSLEHGPMNRYLILILVIVILLWKHLWLKCYQ